MHPKIALLIIEQHRGYDRRRMGTRPASRYKMRHDTLQTVQGH